MNTSSRHGRPDTNRQTRLELLETKHPDYVYRLKNSTYVLEPRKLFYMDVPKCAGTSIKTLLASVKGYNSDLAEFAESSETRREMLIHERKINPVPSLRSFPREKQEEILFGDTWARFCVVRNPYTRIFSVWFSKVLLREIGYLEKLPGYTLRETYENTDQILDDFRNFVQFIYENQSTKPLDGHWDRQTRLLLHDSLKWDRIFKYEELPSVEEYLRQKGVGDGQLGRLNVSGYNPDFKCLGKDTISKIREMFAEDFECFDYDPDLLPSASSVDESLLILYVTSSIARNLRIQGLRAEVAGLSAENGRQSAQISCLKREFRDLTNRFVFKNIFRKTAKRIRNTILKDDTRNG